MNFMCEVHKFFNNILISLFGKIRIVMMLFFFFFCHYKGGLGDWEWEWEWWGSNYKHTPNSCPLELFKGVI